MSAPDSSKIAPRHPITYKEHHQLAQLAKRLLCSSEDTGRPHHASGARSCTAGEQAAEAEVMPTASVGTAYVNYNTRGGQGYGRERQKILPTPPRGAWPSVSVIGTSCHDMKKSSLEQFLIGRHHMERSICMQLMLE